MMVDAVCVVERRAPAGRAPADGFRQREMTMADATEKDRQDLHKDVERLRADISKLTETVSTLVGQEAEQLKSSISGHAQRLAEQGKSLGDQAMREAGAYERQAEEVIIRNPFTAVLVAVGVGFLFGIMSRNR
jgi:ElaB/YqjD/DUF883 family membrane-anchored ribosome-binding protein